MPSELYNIYKDHPEGRWIISWEDAERLQTLIKENGVKSVLDLGSGIGCSSAMIAAAAPDVKVWAVEQFQKCHQIAREITPPKIASRIEFIHSQAVMSIYGNIPCIYLSSFKELPTQPWDLVVIDGPGPFLVDRFEVAKLPNGDIFNIIHTLKPGCLVYVDARETTVLLINRFLWPYLDGLHTNLDGPRGYSLFRRNNVPWRGITDLDFTILKNNGYFK